MPLFDGLLELIPNTVCVNNAEIDARELALHYHIMAISSSIQFTPP